MNTNYRNELELEFLANLNYLENQKESRSLEEFKQLIIETWIGFSNQTISQLNRQYKLAEFELADLNLLYDKRFEAYYEQTREKEPMFFNA